MTLSLVALSVMLGLQIFRVCFPIAFDLGESIGFIDAGLITVAVFGASPLLAAPMRRQLGPRTALVLALGGAVVGRVLIQLVHPVPLALAYGSTMLVLVAWTLLLIALRGRGREGSAEFVLAFLLGLAGDTAMRVAFRTWDHAWQSGLIPVLVTLALAVAILALLARAADRLAAAEHPRGGGLALVALGPFLMLQVLFLQSPAFVASQGEVSLPLAAFAVLIGDALAITAVAWGGVQRVAKIGTLAAGAGLVLATALVRQLDGPPMVVVLMLAQPMAAELLTAVLDGDERAATPWSTSLGVAGGSLLFLALVLAYQIHYESPLPFSNRLLPPFAGALLAVGTAGGVAARAHARADWRLAAVPLMLLLVPASIGSGTTMIAEGNGKSLRLVSYNLHMGVNTEGQVNPEAMARVIEAQRPDVVVLQEVARGWALNGTTDIATWMAARLDMPYVYGPAADNQLGNAILSRLPVVASNAGTLPRSSGTMTRGYVRAVIDIGGETVGVFSTHLQHKDESTQARLAQIEVLLEAWGGADRTVIAGDVNAYPDGPEVAEFLAAGFVSAQDDAGKGNRPTSWQDGTRVDYVFATPDLSFSDFALPFTQASDHLPLAVTVAAS